MVSVVHRNVFLKNFHCDSSLAPILRLFNEYTTLKVYLQDRSKCFVSKKVKAFAYTSFLNCAIVLNDTIYMQQFEKIFNQFHTRCVFRILF